MLSRQDRGERAWHQRDAAWQRKLARWATEDEQHSPYPAARARAKDDRRLALVAHRRALSMSRWTATPPGG
ncbi:hypothetical protein HOV25_gp32 [Pseudomonas phage RLP]|uniref:Uncharacterized protein n=1 Tax=Pseudomonas phage RLP TaxID=2483418 RepID=A0A455P614_9CAUD|nr:hypothetical protein HOV25_gp32 [Pseudomonas phage RLP]AZS49165.1 hypothetical protein RLP_0032 [Pseudomonas phage RLP]